MTVSNNIKCSHSSHPPLVMARQKGMVTLMLTLVLLFAISLTGMYGTYVTIMDIKITAGMLRAQEAYDASEAGLEFAITRFYGGGGDQNADNQLDTIDPQQVFADGVLSGSISSITYEDYTPNGKTPFSRLKVIAVGTSADGLVSRSMSQIVNFSPVVANVPDSPLSVLGDVDIGGSLLVTNVNGNTTIRSKGSVTIGGNASTVTSDGVSSSSSTTGSDIQASDSGMSGMSSNSFFQNYFGISQAQMQTNATVIAGGNNLTADLAQAAANNSVVWISGDARLSSNSTIGSADSPVIIICDGELKTTGSSTIFGIVYSTGGFGAGNLTIDGAALVSGDYTGRGNLSLNYNQNVMNNIQSAGLNAKLTGSWRDF